MNCDSLVGYTGRDYGPINKVLRGQKSTTPVIDAKIAALDKNFNEAPLVPKNIEVYRSLRTTVVQDLKPGDVFQDKGFISTTIGKGAVKPVDTESRMTIRVPKGTKGIYVQEISEFPGEMEMLLNRGTKFKILEVKDREILAEVIND